MGLIEAEGTVAGMIHRGAGFDLIEDWINESTDLDREACAALWLYAWSRQGGSWQRRTSTEILFSAAQGS
jgi:hypothetical protein